MRVSVFGAKHCFLSPSYLCSTLTSPSFLFVPFLFFTLNIVQHNFICVICWVRKKSKPKINLSHRFSFSEHLKLSWGVVYMCANIIYIYIHTHRHVKNIYIYIYIYILITSNNFVHNVRGIEDYCNQSILIWLKQGVVQMPL